MKIGVWRDDHGIHRWDGWMLTLEGNKAKDNAADLYRAAAQCLPKDAMERLHVEAAKAMMKLS
jgi:hypothetical protein